MICGYDLTMEWLLCHVARYTTRTLYALGLDVTMNKTMACTFRFFCLNLHLVKGKQLRLPKNFVHGVIYLLNKPADLYGTLCKQNFQLEQKFLHFLIEFQVQNTYSYQTHTPYMSAQIHRIAYGVQCTQPSN